jgi:hypothetical protein
MLGLQVLHSFHFFLQPFDDRDVILVFSMQSLATVAPGWTLFGLGQPGALTLERRVSTHNAMTMKKQVYLCMNKLSFIIS